MPWKCWCFKSLLLKLSHVFAILTGDDNHCDGGDDDDDDGNGDDDDDDNAYDDMKA